ncbi:MAG: TonB family protein [Dysgonamonadaceae bacterium]|jgi:TonB family protein|nr:TonB family protein [Dysgonamonadaceae bacterium]
MQKERIFGFVGSCLFCGLLFLVLYFTFIKTQIKAGEEGILVRFGTVDESAGTFEPREEPPQSVPEPQKPTLPVAKTVQPQIPKPEIRPVSRPQSQSKPTTPTITQNKEESAAIAEARQKQKEQERIEAERRIAQAAAQAKVVEEQNKRDAINREISGAFGAATSGNSQSGTAPTGTSRQGNPQSTSTTGAPSGSSGYGEFNLGGRTLGPGGLPRPAYSVQEEGKIVINITVDPQGSVISAEIGKGTTIDNNSMRQSAREAAQKARFNNISGNNNQSGTITYKYTLK